MLSLGGRFRLGVRAAAFRPPVDDGRSRRWSGGHDVFRHRRRRSVVVEERSDTPDRDTEERKRHHEAQSEVSEVDRAVPEFVDRVGTPHQEGQRKAHREAEKRCHEPDVGEGAAIVGQAMRTKTGQLATRSGSREESPSRSLSSRSHNSRDATWPSTRPMGMPASKIAAGVVVSDIPVTASA